MLNHVICLECLQNAMANISEPKMEDYQLKAFTLPTFLLCQTANQSVHFNACRFFHKAIQQTHVTQCTCKRASHYGPNGKSQTCFCFVSLRFQRLLTSFYWLQFSIKQSLHCLVCANFLFCRCLTLDSFALGKLSSDKPKETFFFLNLGYLCYQFQLILIF